MWVRRWKNKTTYYNKVTPRDFTNHLAAKSKRIENIDVMALQQAMANWRREDTQVTKYLNRIRYVQKKEAHASLPISNEWLTAIATIPTLVKNSSPTAQDK